MQPEHQTSHARWQAVSQRNPAFHASFLYGVRSTKVYCRPTCSARLARRVNVVFYDTEAQAIRDGFRPCRRCKPDDGTFLGDKEEIVIKVLGLLQIKRSESTMKYGLKELAKQVNVTPTYLCRVFKKVMGMTIGQYMQEFENTADDGGTDYPRLSPTPSSEMRATVADPGVESSGSAILTSPTISSTQTASSPVPTAAGAATSLSPLPDVEWNDWQLDTQVEGYPDGPDIFFNYQDFEADFNAQLHEWART